MVSTYQLSFKLINSRLNNVTIIFNLKTKKFSIFFNENFFIEDDTVGFGPDCVKPKEKIEAFFALYSLLYLSDRFSNSTISCDKIHSKENLSYDEARQYIEQYMEEESNCNLLTVTFY